MEAVKVHFKSVLNKQFSDFISSIISKRKITKQNIVIDYSSPNLAKPFHVGHLKTTLLGNYISNLNELFGQNVFRINYIGDWGTQLGYLLYGLRKFSNKTDIKSFSEIYAKSYKQFNSEEDMKEIRFINTELQRGNIELIEQWQNIRNVTYDYLCSMYQRLGLSFTAFEYESNYHQLALDLVKKLRTETKFIEEVDGSLCFKISSDKRIVMVSSRNDSLYISRDLAAAINRIKKYNAHKLYYVVESGQYEHFQNLQAILSMLDYSVNTRNAEESDRYTDIHVPFGRISGISTRLGNSILVEDALEYMRKVVGEHLRDPNKYTKTVDENQLRILNEQLAVSVLFCDFLCFPRKKHVNFVLNWNSIGFQLQYSRVAINSLEKKCLENNIVDLDFSGSFHFLDGGHHHSLLLIPAAKELLQHLDKFESVLWRCFQNFDSATLLQYTVKLKSLINVALREVRVLGAPSVDDSKSRLKLFLVSRMVLDSSLRLLGIPLVDKI